MAFTGDDKERDGKGRRHTKERAMCGDAENYKTNNKLFISGKSPVNCFERSSLTSSTRE